MDRASNTHIMRLAMGSVVIGLLVLGLKVLAWQLTGSLALMSDALESLVNVATALAVIAALHLDRKSTRLNSSHLGRSRMPSSA